MVARGTKLREASAPAPMPAAEPDERLSQRKKPEIGRYLLRVDRQTKASYPTSDTAIAAGMIIKTGHPHVQVSVYDSVDYQTTLVDLPAAPQ